MLATALSSTFLLGAAGLCVDIGRMYIAKSEAQAYVDSAALSAARYLDGTSAGITKATNGVAANTGKWAFDTSSFTDVTVVFATSAAGPWTSAPSDPTGYNYVKVTTTLSVPMYLIRVLSGPTSTVSASAVAGRTQVTTMRYGVFPFASLTRSGTYTDSNGISYSPVPDDPTDPFGYKIGNEYTLRWGAPGDNTDCGTDGNTNTTTGAAYQPLATSSSQLGYCCVQNTAATLRQSIVSGDTDSETIGANVAMDTGDKNTEMAAIGWRVAEDSDTTSTTYTDYVNNNFGNGARVVVVPVTSGQPTNFRLVGFAAFFLKQSSYYSKLHGNDSACAIYIGAWTSGVPPAAPGSGSGAWVLRLVQ